VATAFRALLQARHDGVPRGVVERALQALEAAALRTIDAFEAQQIANTLHIMAKSRYHPWNQNLVSKLGGRAEALAGSFNAQEVAHTLWAYATMGRAPGEGLIRELEGRAGGRVCYFLRVGRARQRLRPLLEGLKNLWVGWSGRVCYCLLLPAC